MRFFQRPIRPISHLRRKAHGFSIMELIVAFCLIAIGFFTFFSVFSTGAHHAIQTQNRAAATMIAQSYMDEFRTHTFGTAAPKSWKEKVEKPVRMVIKDRESSLVFHKLIKFESNTNFDQAAFVNPDANNKATRDKVTLIITWREPAGINQAVNAPTGFPDDNKMIQVEMPVWR